ncbi:phosphotransferase family enzyme [Propionicimonas paludicola]|uniref:Phosphotransferase family enzyme n=1 Tax=Propionicimonas paludicola TaxID=185243 RepID=A0A2A9CT43_9ACTN|nr:aminoglycoside phosphotransferase family protein [Propionicimonas paludicola]PFG17331.1 phosphotransferase family enzyme [Propionicimonas paludicola]
MTDDELLQGGVNSVLRRGELVHRPAGRHTPTVHRLLTHLRRQGFDGAPMPVGFDDEGREVLTYVVGDVYESLPPGVRTTALVASAGALLRRLHDASLSYEQSAHDEWMLPPRHPAEVICHGDIAPYNSAVRRGRVVGFIDFDTAHPAPRLWDVAYAVYRYAPLHAPDNPESAGSVAEQAVMASAFCHAYGVEPDELLLDTVAERLTSLMAHIRDQAASGNAAFERHVADGHLASYEADIRYVVEQRGALLREFSTL